MSFIAVTIAPRTEPDKMLNKLINGKDSIIHNIFAYINTVTSFLILFDIGKINFIGLGQRVDIIQSRYKALLVW